MESNRRITMLVKDAIGINKFTERELEELRKELKEYSIDEQNLSYSYAEYQDKIKYFNDLELAFNKYRHILDSTTQVQELSCIFGQMRKVKEKGSISKLFEKVKGIYKDKIVIVLNKNELEILKFDIPI